MDTLEKVTEVVRLFYRPASVNEISEAANLSRQSVLSALNTLVKDGTLEKVQSGMTVYFQTSSAGKSDAEKNLEKRFVELDEALNEKIVKHNRRIERIEKETEHIYANMISIMGVFVAIFALIVINANAIAGTISADTKICDALLKLAILNIPVVICIIALLIGVRFIILKDFKRGDHK